MHIGKLVADENANEELFEDSVILQEVKKSLYFRRYVTTEENCLKYFHGINSPKLVDNERVKFEGKVTPKECWEALVFMGSNTSSGNDGITKDYYVCFFAVVGPHLVKL